MQQFLRSDSIVLENHGFTAERQEKLDQLIGTLESLNLEQNILLNER
jgi:hypothetical protein